MSLFDMLNIVMIIFDQTLQSVASDFCLYYLSMSHKKNASLIWVKYFCCLCYLHQLYCFFSSNWIMIGYRAVLTI